jgi:hypothetical protein
MKTINPEELKTATQIMIDAFVDEMTEAKIPEATIKEVLTKVPERMRLITRLMTNKIWLDDSDSHIV